MFDAKQLLDALAGNQIAARAMSDDINQMIEKGRRAAADAATCGGTAVADALGQAEAQLKGTQAGEMLGQAKDLASQNPMATTAVIGGLAAMLLGTRGGRSVAATGLKLGGLAAIGALAYKAYRNYQGGKPLTEGVPGLDQLTAPPAESRFSDRSQTDRTARLMLQAMVATAAADGSIDPDQRRRILAEMQSHGLDAEAATFLEHAIEKPATVAAIASAVGTSRELALEVYAAAQLMAVTAPEKAFVADLAKALHLDPALIAHLDAAQRAVAATP